MYFNKLSTKIFVQFVQHAKHWCMQEKNTAYVYQYVMFNPSPCLTYLHIACWIKTSVDDFLKYFPQKIGLDISCKLSLWRQFAWYVKAYFPRKLVVC